MMELILHDTNSVTNSLFFILTIGVVFFAVSTIAMVVLFGWSIKDAGKNMHAFAVLLLISITVPFGTYYLQQNAIKSEASPSIQIHSLEVVDIDDNSLLIQFETDSAAIIYLEITDKLTGETVPLLPTSNIEKKTSHSFIIPKSQKGSEVVFNINGKKYLIDNKPYLINK